MVKDCGPMMGCNCCDCQGKKCLVSHPGHSCGRASNKYMIVETCPECQVFSDRIDRMIYHNNGHVWPGFAGDP